MIVKRNIIGLVVIAGVCLAASRIAVPIPARSYGTERREDSYQVETTVTTPEYKTDTARVMDAYERLMERYMDMAQVSQMQAGADCQAVMQKLNSIDARLIELSMRLARIEKAMGIDPNAAPSNPKITP